MFNTRSSGRLVSMLVVLVVISAIVLAVSLKGVWFPVNASSESTRDDYAVTEACTSTFQFAFGGAGTAPGFLNQPRSVSAAPNGNIVVADTANSRIEVFDSAGTFVRTVSGPGVAPGTLNQPRGVAVTSAGNIVVADTLNNRLQVFDSAGTFVRTVGSAGSAAGLLNQPRGVAVTTAGDIVVADTGNNRVQVFDSNGTFVRVVGGPGTGNGLFNQPGDVDVNGSGNFVVADTANSRVQVVSPTGTFVAMIGGPGTALGTFNQPNGVAVTAGGNIVVADTSNNRVQILDSAGTFQLLVGGPGTGNGLFNQPSGVAVNASGNIVVADTSNNRGQVFAGCPVSTPPTLTNGRILFSSGRAPGSPTNLKVHTMNADGSDVQCLMCGTGDTRIGRLPAISPNGSTIAYVDTASPTSIHLMNADGTNDRILTTGSSPTWSPQSDRILFTRSVSTPTPHNELFIISANGGTEIPLNTSTSHNNVLPAWSTVTPAFPDGRIAFRTSRDGNSEIYIIAPTAGQTFQTAAQINVTNNPATDSDPAWSPDGNKLAFQSDRYQTGALGEIYTMAMDPNPGTVTRLTNDGPSPGGFQDSIPVWSPDGTKIAYVSFRGNFEIIVINAATGAPVEPPPGGNITNNSAIDFDVDWAAGAATSRVIRAVDVSGTAGQQVVVSFELVSSGDEAAVSFTVNFDQDKLSNPVATIGNGVPSGAQVGTNISQVASGKVGVLVDSVTVFTAGTRQLLTLRFNVASNATAGTTPITFGNTPTAQSVTNTLGGLLPATYTPGNVTIAAATATNGKIAYQQGGRATSNIYTITPGSGISTGLRRGFHPAYSPDGSKIAFTDNTAGPTDGFLMLMDANGSNVRQLATPRQGFTPTWSPDGTRLAFVRGDFNSVGDNGKGQIYVVDMTPGSEGANEVLIPTGTRSISKPAWGATNRIVAACYDPFPGVGTDPKGVCVTGAIPPSSQIAANPPTFALISGQNTNDREATWSPDGSRVAFISTRDYPMFNASEIYSANPDGSSPTRLTNTVDFKSQPTWSPDGTRIAYSRGGSQGSTNAVLRSVNADGSNATTPAVITNFGSGDVFPNWGAQSAATPTPTPTPNQADLRISSVQDSPDPVSVGQTLLYQIFVNNTGPAVATNVLVTSDALPTSVDFLPSQSSSYCNFSVSNRRVACLLPTSMPASGTGSIVQVTVAVVPRQAGTLAFAVEVAAAQGDPDNSNNRASAQTTVIPASIDLAMNAMGDDTDPVGQGSNFNYVFSLRNLSAATATGVKIVFDPIPMNIRVHPIMLNCSTPADRRVTCTFPDLPGSASSVPNVTFIADQAGTIAVAASVSSDASDPNTANNARVTTTEIVPPALLQLVGMEVTQAIQDLANSVPLVETKPTFVRAYVENRASGSPPAVRGSLIGHRIETGGGRTSLGTLSASNDGGTVRVLGDSNRAFINDSFLFELPEEWRTGTVELEFRAAGYTVDCQEPDLTSDCKSLVAFRKMNKLSINFVLGKWTDASNVVHEADFGDALQAAAEIRARFPIYEFDHEITSITFSNNPCNPGTGAIIPEVQTMRDQDIANGKTVKRFYLGLAADQSACGSAFANNGIAYSPGNSSAVFTRRNGNAGTGPGTPTMDGNSRAHELAHNFGIKHTNSGGGEADPATDFLPADGRISTGRQEFAANTAFGFDIYALNSNLDGNRIFPAATFDFMSYQRPRWVSVYNYLRLFNLIGTAGSPMPVEPHLGDTVTASQTVVVRGRVSANPVSGVIDPIFIKETNGSIQLPAAGTHAIRFLDASGQELSSFSFEPPVDSEGDRGPFSLVLPWNPAAKRVVLLRNGQEIASRVASANAPTVTVVSPNGGENLAGSSTTITWTAMDTDGNPLTYAIDHSSNGGTSWSSIASGLTSTSYVVDLRTLVSSSQTLFRVTVSDGFNVASDRSNSTCTIPPKAPVVSIITPQNDQLYVGDQMIILNGISLDIEDGFLEGSALSWSSNLNGPLGTGTSLAVNAATLQEGTHTITLSATDSLGGIGTASIAIRVFPVRPTFPAALSVIPTRLTLQADVGSNTSAPQSLSIRNSGDGTLTWSATANQPWIRLSATAGTAPSNLDITVNATGLAAGNYTGSISITASSSPGTPMTVPVQLTVVPPSTVNGRILTPSGLGLRNAVVSLIAENGTRRIATTSSFGLFSFSNVPNVENYTITVSSKRYRFAPRIITVNGNLNLGDIFGLE